MKTVLLLALITLAACHDLLPERTATGGPCKYTYDTLATVVLKIIPVEGDNGYDILFRNTKGGDTLLYSQTNNGYASKEDLANYNIHPGSRCTLMAETAHGGACPSFFTTSLMHYWKADSL